MRALSGLTRSVAALLVSLILASPAGAQDSTATAEKTPHVAGSGFRLVTDPNGTLNFKLYAAIRYLNQTAIDDTYTDSFGTTTQMDPRQDLQLNKTMISFLGWFLDPRFRYLAYVWTSNASLGQTSQVVVAGNLGWKFSDAFDTGIGVMSLPGTRSTQGNWPYWLSQDTRLIADEFFRPSYTTGIWSKGRIAHGLDYNAMWGNNLSQFGIDAGQLDNQMNTFSGALSWLPTTGEYGPTNGYGDYEDHERLATRLGLHYTYSEENRQGQPSTEAPENSQIRLSDGNVIFSPGLFGPGSVVTDIRYQMASGDFGFKKSGFALEGDYFLRRVDDIRGLSLESLAFDHLVDQGAQVQLSAMLKPKELQVYAAGSKIFGEYGDPWDAKLGLNWFPARTQTVRLNAEWIRVDRSPVGALSLPLLVGATGSIYHANIEVNF